MKLPGNVGPIHFIGIGGIGMSGIAEVMATLGYKVQGSDLTDNYNVARLRKNGIDGHVGQQLDGFVALCLADRHQGMQAVHQHHELCVVLLDPEVVLLL